MNLGDLSGIMNIFSGKKQHLIGGSLILALIGFFWQGESDQPAAHREDQVREITTVSEYARGYSRSEPVVSGKTGASGIQRQVEDLARKHPTWGNAAMRLGMSFFVAMMIALLLKAFIRTMLTVVVVVGVALFFMEQRGMIEPFWDHQMGFLMTAKDWMASQTETIVGFLKGSLPSTGAASAGFFVGLRR